MYQKAMFSTVVPVGKFLQLTDPSDGAGTELSGFRLCQTYPVDRDRVDDLCQMLYQRVLEQLRTGSLGHINIRLMKYVQDLSNPNGRINSDERSFIVVTRETIRHTRATAFIRFHRYDEHLYVGIDAYVLGGVRWGAFIQKCLITLFVFSLFTFFPVLVQLLNSSRIYSGFGAAFDPSGFSGLLFLVFLLLFWWETIRRMIQNKGNVLFSLRQAFRNSSDFGTFNSDDILMFLKPTLQTAVLAIREVFQEEGLPVKSLDDFAQTINSNQTFTGPGA
jgi:hypothetical protein